MDDKGISDDILRKAQDDVEKLLQDRKLSKTDRTQLEIQSYFLMFLINDHKKINEMYPFYLEQARRLNSQRQWWDRLQWIIIPLIVAGVFTFIYQAAVFYFRVVPLIENLGK